jgi:uncharacterized membrane protein
MLNHNLIYNFGAFFASCVIVLGYYVYLRRRVRHEPGYAVQVVNARVRAHWVETVMSTGKMDILAIQTLRNSVMAANFMASTAILLMLAVLNFSEGIENLGVHAPVAYSQETIRAVQSGLLLIDFFVAFFCFSMAIRFYNHVGYMITVPADRIADEFSPQRVAAYLNRAGSFYSFGTRTFFFSFPLMLWFIGPWFLISTTVGLVIALYVLDRAL